jgi:hypothetical protein
LQLSTDTVIGVTSIDSLLENIGTVDQFWPTVDEIGMKTVSRGITVRKHPSRLRSIVEWEVLNLVDEFVE